MIFQVQIRYKNIDNTENIKSYKFEGLFDAQKKAFGLYQKLIQALKPEALERESFLLWILRDGEPVEVFESKTWKETGAL
jgi:hypothetical protein